MCIPLFAIYEQSRNGISTYIYLPRCAKCQDKITILKLLLPFTIKSYLSISQNLSHYYWTCNSVSLWLNIWRYIPLIIVIIKHWTLNT